MGKAGRELVQSLILDVGLFDEGIWKSFQERGDIDRYRAGPRDARTTELQRPQVDS